MNNIWIPAYKILANTVFLDITSFTYDLDSIKLVLTDDNNKKISVNVNIRMYNFDDVQCTVIPSVAYGFVTGMNLQLC